MLEWERGRFAGARDFSAACNFKLCNDLLFKLEEWLWSRRVLLLPSFDVDVPYSTVK